MALKKHPFNLDGFFEVLGRDGGARGRMAETQVFKDRLPLAPYQASRGERVKQLD